MTSSEADALAARLSQVERELKELRQRLAALERLMGSGEEHPTDQTTVRKKVSYDWQA
ncbi:MAG: hypothetical protein ACHQ0I_02045 [Candidatus Lutacidiplasmatales archaeon]